MFKWLLPFLFVATGAMAQNVTGGSGGSYCPTLAIGSNGNNCASTAFVVNSLAAATMSANAIKGNNTGSTGPVLDLTAAQVQSMLPGPAVYVCLGAADDTPLQNAINAAVAAGKALQLQGACVTTGTISINGALHLYGQSKEQTLISFYTTGIGVAANANNIIISDMLWDNANGNTTQTLLKFATGATLYQWSIVERMNFASPTTAAIDTGGSSGIIIRDNLFAGNAATNSNMIISRAMNTPQCNGGENMIRDNYFIGVSGNGQTAITTGCIGGLYIQNNKFVNVDKPIVMYAPTGIASGDLLIQGNSIEQFMSTAIQLNFAGGAGSFEDVMIQNNEIKWPMSAAAGGVVEILTTGGANWLYNVSITGNHFGGFTSGANVLINIQSGQGIDISHNHMQNLTTGVGGNYTMAIIMGAGAATCTLGPNLTLGTFNASAITPTCSPLVVPY